MIRGSIALALSAFVAIASLPGQRWVAFTGLQGEEWSRLGTDGTNLFMTTAGNQLWMYSWPQDLPNLGIWVQLPDCPRTIDGWDSYRGLAYQSGYLYTSAIANPGPGRTMVRYGIATTTWEIWGNPTGTGADLNICNTSGNALFMDPAQTGVGYSAWHGGNWWVTFDWNAQTANNNWMTTSGLPVTDPQWVSRNEDIADDGSGNYFSMKNDWVSGLSTGDAVYTFQLNSAPAFVAQKPWQAGAGQTLEFIAATHPLNTSGNDELWLFRGGDGLSASQEGWSTAGTRDWGIYDLVNNTWNQLPIPLYLGQGSDSVKIGDYVFVKAGGDATSSTVYNDDFMVATIGATFERYGDGCPGTGSVEPVIFAPGGPPTVGNQAFQVSVIGGPSSAPAILVAGFSNQQHLIYPLPLDLTPFGVGGCFLNASADVTTFLLLGGNGIGAVNMPIPNSPTLVGFNVYFQWFVVDPGAPNTRGISTSKGAQARLE